MAEPALIHMAHFLLFCLKKKKKKNLTVLVLLQQNLGQLYQIELPAIKQKQ